MLDGSDLNLNKCVYPFNHQNTRAAAATSSRVPAVAAFLSTGCATSSTTVGITVMRKDVVRKLVIIHKAAFGYFSISYKKNALFLGF